MSAMLCNVAYTRPAALQAPGSQVLHCTYIRDHPALHHSWFAVKAQDETDLIARHTPGTVPDPTPEHVQDLLDKIASGQYDLYLEAILAVGHNRKRARRGTVGFR